MTTIWLDMDGTLADLYGVENWLPMLRAYDPTPYEIAKPIPRMATLARMLNNRQRKGYRIAVITALSKESTADYDAAVMVAKMEWLAKHLPSVHFDELKFVPYTYVKNDANRGSDILVDDEERHLTAWTGTAINAKNIIEGLKAIA